MPLPSDLPDAAPAPAPAAGSWPRAVARLCGRVVVVVIVAFCVLLLAIRFVAFPQLERHQAEIAGLLARQIGQPVEIGSLTSGWDGWNPRLDVSDFRIVDRASGAPVLSLPALHLTVAWTSLLFLDLRFKELALERPELAISRDGSGMLHVAGLAIDPNESRSDSRLADWLLRQRRIVVHDGALVWNDEQRGAPPLALKRVELRLENGFGRHRFGLTATPPHAVAGALDLRGDMVGRSLGAWRSSHGRIYARLDYADVAAWRAWVPLPIDVQSGKGALRVWLDYADGQAREVIADVVLTDVQAKLAPELRELAVTRLDGRLGWRSNSGTRQFFVEHLGFTGTAGATLDPTDLKLTLRDATPRQAASGAIEFSNLQLAPVAQIAENLPLPERWRRDLGRYLPRGTLTEGSLQWTGEATEPASFAARAKFSELGLTAQDGWPGLSGVSGSFDATDKRGSVKLQSRAVVLDLPRILDDKVALDSLQGGVAWQRTDGELAFSFDQVAFSNPGIAGSANGSYRTASGSPGIIDLTAQVTRADAKEVYRYVPAVLPLAVRGWLRRSLVAGAASDARLRLNGNLADFPFADAKQGQFQLVIKARGVTLDYAESWPPFTDVDGEVRLEGPHLTVTASRGQMFDSAVSRAKVEIADLRAPEHLLRIDGEASGPSSDFLKFIAQSPVNEWTDHVTDGAEASGNGTLALKVDLPLSKPDATRIDGEYAFDGNQLRLPGGVPPLSKVSGKLAFTEHDLRAPQITADVLGGTARLAVTSSGGRIRVAGQGSLDLGLLRTEYPKMLIAQRVSGSTDWQLTIDASGETSTGVIETSLRGAKIDLPPPLAKQSGEAVPLRLERRVAQPGRDTIVARYGKAAQLSLQRRFAGMSASIERALLVLGEGGGEPDRPGLWIRGSTDALDADAWLVVKRDVESTGGVEELPLAGIDLTVHELDAFGRRFNDLHIGATHAADAWHIDLAGRELAGHAQWEGSARSRPNGRIAAQLQRLTVPAPSPAPEAAAATAASEKAEAAARPNPWPEIDIVADSFLLHGRDLGKLELTAQPKGADWQIQRVQLASDDGKLSANGWWRASQRRQQTTLDAELDVSDAGKYLARFGLPDAVRGAASKIRGQVAWAGGPDAFDYPTLSGAFRIDSGTGQFIKVDPGVGKLLGVLSLQSLQRRLAFDFHDLFGEGFAFDQLNGDVKIVDGLMKSDNLRIVGPAARVSISGETDLARETQQLRIRVQPTLSAGVSVGAAVLLLANPIIGAAVGAGSLLAQKVLQDPIEQIFSYEYVVSGSWSDPVVERAGRQPVVAPAADANGEHR
ncbi:MAG TPA: YhdP family protein [Casimicrobiaceae bacterium]|nr:YhdP family protein [Casimicrobiaceae bacterium]